MRTATDPAHTKRHCLLPNIQGALRKRCSCQRAYSQSSSACGISRVLAQSLFSGFDAHQLRAIAKSKKNIFSSWSKSHAPRFPPLLMVLMHLFDTIRTQWLHGQTGRTLRTARLCLAVRSDGNWFLLSVRRFFFEPHQRRCLRRFHRHRTSRTQALEEVHAHAARKHKTSLHTHTSEALVLSSHRPPRTPARPRVKVRHFAWRCKSAAGRSTATPCCGAGGRSCPRSSARLTVS